MTTSGVARALLMAFFVCFGALLTFTVAAFVCGCARPLDTAIVAANTAREVLVEAKPVITDACAPAYERTRRTTADLAAVDRRCMPAVKAYTTLRAAWVIAVAAIGAAQAGGDTAKLLPAVAEMARGFDELRRALFALPLAAPPQVPPKGVPQS